MRERLDDGVHGAVAAVRDGAEAVAGVLEVVLPAGVAAAQDRLGVELVVDDRAFQVRRVEGDRGEVGDQHAGPGEELLRVLALVGQRLDVVREVHQGQPRQQDRMRKEGELHSLVLARGSQLFVAKEGKPAADEVGLQQGRVRDPLLGAGDDRGNEVVAPGRGDQQEVAALGREAEPDVTEPVEPGQAGEDHLAGREDVRRVVADDRRHLPRGAHHERVELLEVEPRREVVLDHAVLQEVEAPTRAGELVDRSGRHDRGVRVRGEQMGRVRHQQPPLQRAVRDQPVAVARCCEPVPLLAALLQDEPGVDLGVVLAQVAEQDLSAVGRVVQPIHEHPRTGVLPAHPCAVHQELRQPALLGLRRTDAQVRRHPAPTAGRLRVEPPADLARRRDAHGPVWALVDDVDRRSADVGLQGPIRGEPDDALLEQGASVVVQVADLGVQRSHLFAVGPPGLLRKVPGEEVGRADQLLGDVECAQLDERVVPRLVAVPVGHHEAGRGGQRGRGVGQRRNDVH